MKTATMVFCVSCMLVLVVSTSTAQAQRRGLISRRARVLSVAAVPEVVKKLEFTYEQTALAGKLRDELSQVRDETFQGYRDLSSEERNRRLKNYYDQQRDKHQQFSRSVGEKKFQRVQQLSYQVGGYIYALFDRETRLKLEITEEQQRQAFAALREMREEFQAAGDDAEALKELRKKVNGKVAETFTEEQKSKWKKLLGEPADEKLLAAINKATSARR